jgi:hypothetical protein
MTLTTVLDAVVAALLVATIVYAMLLSRRLAALRDDKQQLEALIRSLDQSAQRAEAGIASLKLAADRIGQELQQQVDRGQGLRTDLGYMIEMAGGLADRLETTIRATRGDASPVADPGKPRRRERTAEAPAAAPLTEAPGEGARVADFPSRAERLLRRALEARR